MFCLYYGEAFSILIVAVFGFYMIIYKDTLQSNMFIYLQIFPYIKLCNAIVFKISQDLLKNWYVDS